MEYGISWSDKAGLFSGKNAQFLHLELRVMGYEIFRPKIKGFWNT